MQLAKNKEILGLKQSNVGASFSQKQSSEQKKTRFFIEFEIKDSRKYANTS